MRTLATLLLLGMPLLAQLTIPIDGQPRTSHDLAQLQQAAQAELDALERDPPANPEVLAAKRKEIKDEIDALEEAIRLLDRLAKVKELQPDLARDLEEERQQLAGARAESEQEISYPSMDAATLDGLVNEAQKATQAVGQAETQHATVEKAFNERQALPQKLPEQLTTLEIALQGLKQRLAAAPPAVRPGIERQLRTTEVRQRLLETQRDHHVELLAEDRSRRDLAQVRLDLARIHAVVAERKASEARKVLQAVLEQEADEARREAESQRRAAELAGSPARRAIAAVLSLAADMESAALADEARLNRLDDAKSAAASRLDLARRRLDFARRQIVTAESAVLGSRFPLLIRGITRARMREEEFEHFREQQAAELATSLRDAYRGRDDLDLLKDVIGESKRPGSSSLDLERGASAGTPADRLLNALDDFEAGKAKLSSTELQAFNEEWLTGLATLERALEKRFTAYEALLAASDALRDTLQRIEDSIEERVELLEGALLWSQRPAPLSSPWRAAVATEARDLVSGAGTLPELTASSWATWRGARILGLPAGWGLTALVAIVIVIVLGGRWRPARGRMLPLRSALRQALPVAALLAVVAGAVEGVPRGDVIRVALTGVLTVATGMVFLRGWARSLDATEEQPDPRRRFVRRTLLIEVILAVAAALLFVAGAPSLAQTLRIIALVAAIALAIWLLRRRRLLCRLVLGSHPGDAVPPISPWIVFTTGLTAVALIGALALELLGYQRAGQSLAWRSLLAATALLLVVGIVQTVGDRLRQRLLSPTPGQAEDDEDQGSAGQYPLVLQTLRLLLITTGTGLLGLLASFLFAISRNDWAWFAGRHLTEASDSAPGMTVGRLVKAIAIVTVATFAARYVREILKRSLRSQGRLQEGSRFAIRTLVSYAIIGVGVLSGLSALGLNLEQFAWFITAAGVGIGFGLQEVISNFIAGLILFFERPVQVGDVVTIGSIEGNVQRISIRATTVRSRDGISIIVPNRRFITDDVVNWSHGDPRTRLHVSVGVAYGSDVALVKKILLDVAEREGRILKRPRPEVTFREFGDSQLSFEVLVWLPTPDIGTRRRVASDLNSAIDAAFRRADITIPFPQRDLHLKTVPEDLKPAVEDPPEEPQQTTAS